nr:hypothetical protein [Tanacetum cinerariifolium]
VVRVLLSLVPEGDPYCIEIREDLLWNDIVLGIITFGIRSSGVKVVKKVAKSDLDSDLSISYFIQYTGQAILEFRDTLIQHLESVKKSSDERVQLKREYDSRVNERQMQTTEEKVDTSQALDASSVDKESKEAKKKTQEQSRNSKPSLIPSAILQSTNYGSKPMPRRNTQTSRIWPATKNNFITTKTMPIAEHPRNSRNVSCVTKFLKEVNSRAKVPSNKTTNRNKLVEEKGVPHKQERHIPTGHRRVPTGRILTSNTTKVDSEPLNGSNADITNQYECEQTLDTSADVDVPSQQRLDLLFGPLYDEFFNAGLNPSTNIQSTSAPSTHINVHAEENNNDPAEEGEHILDDKFTNPFCASTQEVAESSSHNTGNSNVPTFNQPQVATDLEMCMYTLTVSTAELKNIKEAMADFAWIEAMQEELHQFDRLQVWELVDKPFSKLITRLKWLWKNKKDEDQIVIHNKARLVAKGTQVFSNLSDGRENSISQWPLKEEVYVAQPDRFVDPGHPEKVYRLRKALYGLKQAPRAWYEKLSKFLISKDADHAGCIDSRKSTSGGIQFLGDKLVSWMSKKQNCTAMSSADTEYVALSASYAQVMWMRTLLQDYGFNYNKIPLYCDSQSAIAISCN